jgi:hypothetical protein
MTRELIVIQGTPYALYAKHEIHRNPPDLGPALFEGASLYDWETLNSFETSKPG